MVVLLKNKLYYGKMPEEKRFLVLIPAYVSGYVTEAEILGFCGNCQRRGSKKEEIGGVSLEIQTCAVGVDQAVVARKKFCDQVMVNGDVVTRVVGRVIKIV
jgi:hypothetical protein